MDIEKNDYFEAKETFEINIDYRYKKNGNILTLPIIARLHYDDVDYNTSRESDIISEILFQNAIIEKMGFIYSSYLPLLSEVITEFDAGYKFTVLDEEEYEDLKSIVEKLKGYLAEHSK